MKITWITIIYFLLLICIIYLADHHQYHTLFTVVRSMPGGDKSGHFLLMGLFSFLVNSTLSCRILNVRGRHLLLGSVLVFLLVTLEEISQRFVRYRTFDLVDLLFDYVGIWVFGKAALFLWLRRIVKSGHPVKAKS